MSADDELLRQEPRRDVVLALLTVDGLYVLQHRDDLPGVAARGMWGLFGGHVDPGEDFLTAVAREVDEELSLRVSGWRELWRFRHYSPFADDVFRCTIFHADITRQWSEHVVREGQGAGLFSVDQLPGDILSFVAAVLERFDEARRRRR